ncbi:uncharacterized protein LOC121729561 [Aricia agestis]|uniref:uncharacterized protein LOC121729561 n=1 Tax=Aricia agestis TaxID=91739 RepID=UPI001C207D0C|nr:uncharacterized protein LOC121729561 [Aricia agestis]
MYSSWRVSELKAELTKRGASLRGRKAELVERLELYDRNFNFGSAENQSDDDAMEVPDVRTYRDINATSLLPHLTQTHIRQYFCFDDKKIKEAKALYESRYLVLARVSNVGENTFIKGYCKKTMKQLQYEVNLKLHKSGIPQESNCECPAGSGTEAKCKHVAVLLHGVEHMVHNKILLLHQVCTQKLQDFHMPKTRFTSSPIAAHQLPRNKAKKRFCPFPIQKVDK